MKGVKPKQAARFTVKYLDKLIEAATTDAYNRIGTAQWVLHID